MRHSLGAAFAKARPGLAGRWVFALTLSLPGSAFAQTYLRFDQVPYISTQSPGVFQALFAGAHTGTVRAIMLGDSQETSPWGQGVRYMPRLNFEFYRHYGNAPETGLFSAWGSTGGVPPADWLVRLSAAGPGPTPGRVPAWALPPNFSSAVCSTTSGSNVNNNEIYGCLLMLQHDAADTDPAAGLSTGTEYFKRGSAVYLDVYAATNASSGEVVCRLTPSPSHVPSYYRPTLSTQTSSLGLEDPVPAFKRFRFGPLSFGGQPYMQVELSGSDPTKLTDLIAADFVGTLDPSGWSIASMAAGGYRAHDFLGNHPGALDLIQVYAPNVALIAYGANDGGQGFTAQQFHDNLTTLITAIRDRLGPGFPVILLSDPWRALDPRYVEDYDRFPGVAYAISQELPAVCALNGRRLTDDAGWNAATQSVYLSDSVHYSAAGAALKAQLESQALFAAFDSGCLGPSIQSQPAPVTACAGAGALFSVAAAGSASLSYQWLHAGLPISDLPGTIVGAHSSQLQVVSSSPALAGVYTCLVADECNATLSNAAMLTVLGAPTLLMHPQSVWTCPAGHASFEVAPAGAAGDHGYQWQYLDSLGAWTSLSNGTLTVSGASFGSASGCTSQSLVLGPLDASPVGSTLVVRCLVSNSCGTTASAAASLILQACCPADLDDGAMNGHPDGGVDVSDLLYFLDRYEAGVIAVDLDDGSSTGTPDGGVDINDLLYFIAHYEAGC